MEEMKRYLEYDLQWFAKDGPGGEKTEHLPQQKSCGMPEKKEKVAKKQGIEFRHGSDCPVFGIKSIYIVCRQGLFRRIFSSL